MSQESPKVNDVSIFLNETPTIFLYQQQSHIANFAGPDAEEIQALNQKYADYSAAVATSENFSTHEVQTFHLFHKDKEIKTDEIIKKEAGTQLNLYNLAVVEDVVPQGETPYDLLKESGHPLASHKWFETKEEDLKSSEAIVDFGPNSEESAAVLHQMKGLEQSMLAVERMVQQNIFQDKILDYTTPSGELDQPTTVQLMRFFSDLTAGRPITSLSFNPQSHNFFAAAYGSVPDYMLSNYLNSGNATISSLASSTNLNNPNNTTNSNNVPSNTTSTNTSHPNTATNNPTPHDSVSNSTSPSKPTTAQNQNQNTNPQSPSKNEKRKDPVLPSKGLILIWNILNPGQPERIIETTSVPSSIRFSEGVPYLLAVGFDDGAVGLYDIRKKSVDVIAMSTIDTGSHEGAVGEVVFQQRTDTRVRSEAVVSVAADGHVTQWTVANGLDHKDLVTLKKLKVVTNNGESQTLRYEDLHCLSFSPAQPNIYVVGSEDGALFVCDTQYNEDYVQKLLFHFRAVLCVKFSPFSPGWFISGSCDGSAAIWNTSKQNPVAQFYLSRSTFNDLNWSPISSTVFAAAGSDGEVRIWDISLDTVDPIAKLSPYDKKELTSIDWSPVLPVFITGNCSGVIYLTKVVGLASLKAGRSHDDEEKRFESVIQTMSNQE